MAEDMRAKILQDNKKENIEMNLVIDIAVRTFFDQRTRSFFLHIVIE